MIAHKCVGMYTYCHSCGAMLEFDRFDLEFPDEQKPISETLIPHFDSLQLPRKDFTAEKKHAEKNRDYWTSGFVMCPICGHKEQVMTRSYETALFRDVEYGTSEWSEAFNDLTAQSDRTLEDMISSCEACPSGEEEYLTNVEFINNMLAED